MGRATNEGRVFSKLAAAGGALVELSCETDFVARNKEFIALGEKIIDRLVCRRGQAREAEALEAMVTERGRHHQGEHGAAPPQGLVDAGAATRCSMDYIHGEGRIGGAGQARLGNPALALRPAGQGDGLRPGPARGRLRPPVPVARQASTPRTSRSRRRSSASRPRAIGQARERARRHRQGQAQQAPRARSACSSRASSRTRR